MITRHQKFRIAALMSKRIREHKADIRARNTIILLDYKKASAP